MQILITCKRKKCIPPLVERICRTRFKISARNKLMSCAICKSSKVTELTDEIILEPKKKIGKMFGEVK